MEAVDMVRRQRFDMVAQETGDLLHPAVSIWKQVVLTVLPRIARQMEAASHRETRH
ncbi:MAG: hypothetical protein H7838_06100 [Magnetococcus sp. DMHC-8]